MGCRQSQLTPFKQLVGPVRGISAAASNSTLDSSAPRGMCPDADDPSVEAVRGAVSNPKALELKPGRRHAHHGGILAPGGRRMEPARVAVAGETRRSPGVRDPRCCPVSQGFADPDVRPLGGDGDPFRSSTIVLPRTWRRGDDTGGRIGTHGQSQSVRIVLWPVTYAVSDTPQRARRRCSGLSGPRHAVADAELGHDVGGVGRCASSGPQGA